jgi:hypothetical protein
VSYDFLKMHESMIDDLSARRDSVREFVDNMPNDGKYVIGRDDGSVIYRSGGIAGAGRLVPIHPDGGYATFASLERAEEALRRLKQFNPDNVSLVGAFVTTEGHAFECELQKLDGLLTRMQQIHSEIKQELSKSI